MEPVEDESFEDTPVEEPTTTDEPDMMSEENQALLRSHADNIKDFVAGIRQADYERLVAANADLLAMKLREVQHLIPAEHRGNRQLKRFADTPVGELLEMMSDDDLRAYATMSVEEVSAHVIRELAATSPWLAQDENLDWFIATLSRLQARIIDIARSAGVIE